MTSRKRSAIAHIDSDFRRECLLLHLLQYLAPCKPVQSAAGRVAVSSEFLDSVFDHVFDKLHVSGKLMRNTGIFFGVYISFNN